MAKIESSSSELMVAVAKKGVIPRSKVGALLR